MKYGLRKEEDRDNLIRSWFFSSVIEALFLPSV